MCCMRWNSFAFRNVDSTNKLNEIVLDDTRLDNALGTILGTKDNLFDQALVDSRIGEQLPTDHILNMESKNFLDNVIAQNPTVQKQVGSAGRGGEGKGVPRLRRGGEGSHQGHQDDAERVRPGASGSVA